MNAKLVLISVGILFLSACGEKPVEVNVRTEKQETPIVVQTCDADCQAVLKHREELKKGTWSNHYNK